MPDKNNKCPVCDCLSTALVTEELRDKNKVSTNISVLKCRKCSLVFLSTFEHIGDDFYKNNGMFGKEFDYIHWQKNSQKDDKRRFEFLKKSISNKAVLDFGCGAGGFLKLAQNCTKEAAGLEVNDSVFNFLIKNGFSAYSDIAEIGDKKFDLITMFHVLEHIKSPVNTLVELKNNLKADGEIIIEVPNADDALLTFYGCKEYKKFAYWSCHLYSFNRQNLVRIIKRAGYKINYTKHLQRYGLFNHLRWIFKKQPDGHKSKHFLNKPLVDCVYSKLLNIFKMNDTLILSISPD